MSGCTLGLKHYGRIEKCVVLPPLMVGVGCDNTRMA